MADFFIKLGYKAYAVRGGLKALKKEGGFPICPGLLMKRVKVR